MNSTTDEQTTAGALDRVATWLKYLGTGDAGTTMGAVEYLGAEVRDGSTRIAAGLHDVANAIRERET